MKCVNIFQKLLVQGFTNKYDWFPVKSCRLQTCEEKT